MKGLQDYPHLWIKVSNLYLLHIKAEQSASNCRLSGFSYTQKKHWGDLMNKAVQKVFSLDLNKQRRQFSIRIRWFIFKIRKKRINYLILKGKYSFYWLKLRANWKLLFRFVTCCSYIWSDQLLLILDDCCYLCNVRGQNLSYFNRSTHPNTDQNNKQW